MRVIIQNFDLCKAEGRDDKGGTVLPVRMVANTLKQDRHGEEIVPEAFDSNTVKFFLEHGVIDWHHQSILGEEPEDRARAIIGMPTESIQPHLEADQRIFSASVGGKSLQIEEVLTKAGDPPKKRITKIHWNHLAIAGAPYVISPGSAVTLAKAEQEEYAVFGSWNDFTTGEFTLTKALEAGSGTDAASIQGFNAVQHGPGALYTPQQVLTLNHLLTSIKEGQTAATEKGVRHYLINALGYERDMADHYIRNEFKNFMKGVGIQC